MVKDFVTALVGQPFGLEGFVKIHPLSGSAAHLADKKAFLLREASSGARETNAPSVTGKSAVYTVAASRISGGGVLYLKFDGFETPEAAKSLIGMEIVVPRAEAAVLAENEFYIEDLKGLTLTGADGRELGSVVNVVEGGGGDLLEVALETGEHRFVPFRGEFVGDVDIEKGRAVLLNPWVLA